MADAYEDFAAADLLLSALTQFARERLLYAGAFPAFRPELPDPLRTLHPDDPFSPLLELGMFGESSADLLQAVEEHIRYCTTER